MIDYRKEGLTRMIKEELVPSLQEKGFIKPDFETIGKILCDLYKGEEEKFEKMSERASKVIKEAKELLNSLKNKNET